MSTVSNSETIQQRIQRIRAGTANQAQNNLASRIAAVRASMGAGSGDPTQAPTSPQSPVAVEEALEDYIISSSPESDEARSVYLKRLRSRVNPSDVSLGAPMPNYDAMSTATLRAMLTPPATAPKGVVRDVLDQLQAGAFDVSRQISGAVEYAGIPYISELARKDALLMGSQAEGYGPPETMLGTVARAAPSMAPPIAVAALTGGTGTVPMAAAMLTAGIQSGSSQFQDAKQRGASDATARLEGLGMGAFTTASSAIPLGQYLKRLAPSVFQKYMGEAASAGARGLHGEAAKAFVKEGTKEASEEIVSMALQRWAEDDPSAWDGFVGRVTQAGLVGGILGAGTDVTLAAPQLAQRFVDKREARKSADIRIAYETARMVQDATQAAHEQFRRSRTSIPSTNEPNARSQEDASRSVFDQALLVLNDPNVDEQTRRARQAFAQQDPGGFMQAIRRRRNADTASTATVPKGAIEKEATDEDIRHLFGTTSSLNNKDAEANMATRDDTPAYRDWRWERDARNAGKIKPNRPGQKFTPEQIENVTAWVEGLGLTVTKTSPTMIRVVGSPRDAIQDLSKYGAKGVRDEANVTLRAQEAKADSERRQKAQQEADARPSAAFIHETFGRGAMNAFNQAKLSDFLEGKDDRPRIIVNVDNIRDGLEKYGAIKKDVEGKTTGFDFGPIREAYRRSLSAEVKRPSPEANNQGDDSHHAAYAQASKANEDAKVKPDDSPADIKPDEVTGLREVYRSAVNDAPPFQVAGRKIAEAVGGKWISGPIKTPGRIVGKVRKDYKGDFRELKDVVRGTIEVDTPEEAAKVLSSLPEHLDVARVKDRFTTPTELGYSDILANVRLPSGTIAEIQVNIPEVLAYKAGRGHKIYEEWSPLDEKMKRGTITNEEMAKKTALEDESKAGYRAALDAARRRAASAANSSGETESSSSLRGRPPEKSDRPSAESTQTESKPSSTADTLNAPSESHMGPRGSGSGSGMVRESGTPDATQAVGAKFVRNPSVPGNVDVTENGGGKISAKESSNVDARDPELPGQRDKSVGGASQGGGGDGDGAAGGVDSGAEVVRPGQRGGRGGRRGRGAKPGQSTASVVEADAGASDNAAGGGTDGGREPVGSPRKPRLNPEDLPPQDRNHTIKRGSEMAPSSNTGKFAANLDAIKLLRTLESEDRNPTPEEKAVLARYTGWGWAGEYFNRDNAGTPSSTRRWKIFSPRRSSRPPAPAPRTPTTPHPRSSPPCGTWPNAWGSRGATCWNLPPAWGTSWV